MTVKDDPSQLTVRESHDLEECTAKRDKGNTQED